MFFADSFAISASSVLAYDLALAVDHGDQVLTSYPADVAHLLATRGVRATSVKT